MGGEGSGVKGHHTVATEAAQAHIQSVLVAKPIQETSETPRMIVQTQGTPERIFVTGVQKQSEVNWLNPIPRQAASATLDLNPKEKSVYINRVDADVSRQGYGRELLGHALDKLSAQGYEKATGYVEHTAQDSRQMNLKLGGVPGKLTPYGQYFDYNLKGRVK